MPCYHCRLGGGFVDLTPTALLVSPPSSWELAMGPALTDGRAAAAGYAGLGAAEGGGGGGTSLALISCRCASVASVRSTLVRAAMPCRGSIVATLKKSRNGATRWVIPMASDFACIICHAVASARKGETISGWTRERGPGTPRVRRSSLFLGSQGIGGDVWGRGAPTRPPYPPLVVLPRLLG